MSPGEYNDKVLAALLSLQRDVAQIRVDMAELKLAAAQRASGATHTAGSAGAVADDRELESQYGDPSIRKDPPRWSGQSYVGYKFSETEPEYLDCLASFKEWQADMDEKNNKVDGKGRPTAPYNRKDAARARGWAKRLRGNGGSARSPATGAVPSGLGGASGADGGYGGNDDDIPF